MPEPDAGDESPPRESPADASTADAEVRLARDSVDIAKAAKGQAQVESNPSALSPDWQVLRTRMKRLGVSRYWLEGEPDGRCRFHCLVPLAEDARSVSRQFESEAAEPLKAVDSALRRVALWKATEEE